MSPDPAPRRRHVWVDGSGGVRHPGLLLCWRRREDGRGWEAQVAVVRQASVLVIWTAAADLHPVRDDRRP